MKELVDGTIRVQIDIDPRFRTQFFEMFSEIDMPVALAPLHAQFEGGADPNAAESAPVDSGPPAEQAVPPSPPKTKTGPLCRLAVLACQASEFRFWLRTQKGHPLAGDAKEAAVTLRLILKIASRVELDHDPAAAERFRTLSAAYRKWKKDR